MSFGTNAFPTSNGSSDNPEIDFERLVKGNAAGGSSSNAMDGGAWDAFPANATVQPLRSNSTQAKPGMSLLSFSLAVISTQGIVKTGSKDNNYRNIMRLENVRSRSIEVDESLKSCLSSPCIFSNERRSKEAIRTTFIIYHKV